MSKRAREQHKERRLKASEKQRLKRVNDRIAARLGENRHWINLPGLRNFEHVARVFGGKSKEDLIVKWALEMAKQERQFERDCAYVDKLIGNVRCEIRDELRENMGTPPHEQPLQMYVSTAGEFRTVVPQWRKLPETLNNVNLHSVDQDGKPCFSVIPDERDHGDPWTNGNIWDDSLWAQSKPVELEVQRDIKGEVSDES